MQDLLAYFVAVGFAVVTLNLLFLWKISQDSHDIREFIREIKEMMDEY